eukprot:8543140-Ditylum_brightwellii.AAC.1
MDPMTEEELIGGGRKIVLIGVSNALYDHQIIQHKLLLNLHHLQANGMEVDDVAQNHGGNQCLILSGRTVISLDFDGNTLTSNLRIPTSEELMILK